MKKKYKTKLKKFLKKRGAWDDFVSNYNTTREKYSLISIGCRTYLDGYLDEISQQHAISAAFNWKEHDYDTWKTHDKDWLKLINIK